MNIYLTVMSSEQVPARAIEEAHRLAQKIGGDLGVQVKVCGSQEHLATVFPNGNVHLPKEEPK